MADKDTAERQAELQLDNVVEFMEWMDHADTCTDPECTETRGDVEDTKTYHDIDAARQAINEDALDVQVRSGWESLNTIGEDGLEPQSFAILLCTGGPAVRIVGKLEDRYPVRAQLEYQDWGTPWTRLNGLTREQESALVRYAECFYFDY